MSNLIANQAMNNDNVTPTPWIVGINPDTDMPCVKR